MLDEPTNQMDIRHQLDVLTLLRGLGLTVILTLHDLTPGIIARAIPVICNGDLNETGRHCRRDFK